MNTPDVSVILVSFNTRHLLSRCLQALANSAGSVTYEVIIVDNGSRDGSADFIRNEFPQCKLIVSESNLGFGRANNRGLELACGRYVLALNTDAFLVGDALEVAVRAMENRPKVGAAGVRLVGEDGAWQPSARTFPSLWNEFFTLTGLSAKFPQVWPFGRPDLTYRRQDTILRCGWVPGAFLLIRKSILDKIGFFDERFFLYYEEVDLCRRIWSEGWVIEYWPQMQVVHLGGASTSSLGSKLLSKSGRQMELWRLQSQYLYHRKNGSPWIAWLSMQLERTLHKVRLRKNAGASPFKAEASQEILALIDVAWKNTDGGRISPPQPWAGV